MYVKRKIVAHSEICMYLSCNHLSGEIRVYLNVLYSRNR